MVYGAITFLQSGVFGVCLDIGIAHAGRDGRANEYSVASRRPCWGRWRVHITWIAPVPSMRLFIPMAALLFLGAVLWLKIDASKEVRAEVQAGPVGAGAQAGASEPRVCVN
jgi:hypothetical protein